MEGNVIYWGQGAKALYGYSAEEVMGKPVTFIVEPQEEEEEQERMRQVRETGAWEGQYVQRRRDGSSFWSDTIISLVKDEQGRPCGLIGTDRDITERVRAEEALRESKDQLQALFDNMSNGFAYHRIVTDEAGKPVDYIFLEINEAFERYTGLRRDDIIGKRVTEVLPGIENMAFDWIGTCGQIALTGEPIQFEQYFAPQNHWYSIAAYSPAKGYFAVTFENITERVRAEEEIQRLADVVRNMQVGLYLYHLEDINDDRTLRMIATNPAASQFTGVAMEDVLGKTLDENFAGLREKGIPQLYAQVVRSGQPVELEQVTYGDDRVKQGVFSVKAFPLPGNCVGVAFENITERVRAEEKLKEYSERLEEMVRLRTKELEEAQEELVRKEKLAVLGQLAGGVGHELRNPLGVISNAVYYLKMVLPDADETVREYLDIISSEVHNSEQIVSDLLGFARTRSSDRQRVALSRLVAQVLGKTPPPEGVLITFEIAADLLPVYVDPRQIGQVLANLITNAYQAMPQGGTLTLSASAEGDKAALCFADTGCGISPENIKRLFEPLFTTKPRGIGLGLAVSRSLVEANGGAIEVESDGVPGRGSTFTVWLPLA
jgi:PAS domain S-box-containing protein